MALSDTGEISQHLWPGAGNDRYDRPVSNLSDAPVGSIGGNLRFGRPHFVSAVLLIGGGTSMLRQNARDTLRKPGPGHWREPDRHASLRNIERAFSLPRERLKHPCRYQRENR